MRLGRVGLRINYRVFMVAGNGDGSYGHRVEVEMGIGVDMWIGHEDRHSGPRAAHGGRKWVELEDGHEARHGRRLGNGWAR